MSEIPSFGVNYDTSWYEIAGDDQLRADEQIIVDYAEAQRTELATRYVREMLWYPTADGHIIQIEPDDGHPGDGFSLTRYYSNPDKYRQAGEELRHRRQPAKSLLSRLGFGSAKPIPAKIPGKLSFEYDDRTEYDVLTYDGERIRIPFEQGYVTDGIAHGVTVADGLHLKTSILNEGAIESVIEDRKKYEQAKRVIHETKADMVKTLRGIGRYILQQSGATNIVIDRGNGVEYQRYVIPEHAAFDFKLADKAGRIYVSPSNLDVSFAPTDPSDAFQLDYDIQNGGFALAAAESMPFIIAPEDPFGKLEEARDFPEKVRDAFVAGGFREFSLDFDRLTDALPLVMKLLRAPIDSNHELLTPYFYGLSQPRQGVKVAGPDKLMRFDRNRQPLATYTVDDNGLINEDMPELD